MNDPRSENEREAALDQAAKELPREVEPARDLWPSIRARIDEGRVRPIGVAGADPATIPAPAATIPAHPRWMGRGRLAAAAAALIIVSVTATWLAIEWRLDNDAETRARATVANLERSSAELLASLDRRGATLDPRTRAVLERSIRTIDGAIAEARAALDTDPRNPAVQAFVVAAYRQKVDFLRRANDVAALQGP